MLDPVVLSASADTEKGLIRVEGVNFAHFIFDTDDLNTVRGAGLLLLQVSSIVTKALVRANLKHEIVGDGASFVLVEVERENSERAEFAIKEALRDDERVSDASFAVECVVGRGFEEALKLTTAKARLSQMQAASLVYPKRTSRGSVPVEVCEIDRLRPATNIVDRRDAVDGKRNQSAATFHRRAWGREQKQQFYADELRRGGHQHPDCWNGGYSFELQQLAGNSRKWGNLANKMAVVHLDGNGFGAFFARQASASDFKKHSAQLRDDYQGGLLAELLAAIKRDANWRNPNPDSKPDPDSRDVARLETLLWGGDELTLVVPAWKGLEFLQLFYKSSANWTLGQEPVTHSGGLVFCHYNAPIHPIVGLAEEMTQFVKQCFQGDSANHHRNRFVYLVLESFDHLGQPFSGEYVEKHFPFAATCPDALTITPKQIDGLAKNMPTFRRVVPRRKAIEITRLLRRADGQKAAGDLIMEVRKEMEASGEVSAGAAKALKDLEFQSNAVWFHLTELWDYASPEERREGEAP